MADAGSAMVTQYAVDRSLSHAARDAIGGGVSAADGDMGAASAHSPRSGIERSFGAGLICREQMGRQPPGPPSVHGRRGWRAEPWREAGAGAEIAQDTPPPSSRQSVASG